jgi:membrane protein YqaA with SNARE-associated domain
MRAYASGVPRHGPALDELPFLPCSAYMAVGKGLRYVAFTAAALWLFPD